MSNGVSFPSHEGEPHRLDIAGRLNWLRAGVLGANDGIVSVAAVVVGVAAVTIDRGPIFIAGMAAVVGGAISMALGEYVSVSSQRDSQRALIEKERLELAEQPEEELAELTAIYRERGLSEATARRVAIELTEHDALSAHLSAELNIDQDGIANAWHAAIASAISFLCGAILPMLAILIPPHLWRTPITFAAVLAALWITGGVSARIGGSSPARASARVIIGGALALAATYLIGRLLGATGVA